MPRFRNELQQLIQSYPVEDVFNCDKTALFYRLDSVKTLAHGPVMGRKKAKDCVTLMLPCVLQKPLLIHKYQNPRPLYGIIIIGTRQHGCKLQFSITGFVNLRNYAQISSKHSITRRQRLLTQINDNTTLLNITVHFLPPTPALFIVSKANIEDFIVLI